MILKFLISTGGRISEVSKLKVKDVYQNEASGWFEKSKGCPRR